MDEIQKKWRQKFEMYARQVYIPMTIAGTNDSNEDVTESKFGGRPYTSSANPWPLCSCGQKMQFFLQINSNNLPKSIDKSQCFDEGLLQFFYCTGNCEFEGKGYLPFADCHVVRLISPKDLNIPCETPNLPEDVVLFPYIRINGWSEDIDHITNSEFIDKESISYTQFDQIEFLNEAYINKTGEKLLGWPHWIQGVEYPKCRKCHRTMKYIFQVDSHRNIPYSFGDLGVGHITQCTEHKEQLTFNWACP